MHQTERDLLRNVRRIEIRTDRLSDAFFAGGYHSVFRGLGLEFNEVRPYIAGDDVRTIDWNVTARTGSPHVKSFVEERELTVMLLVDASASLDFGTRRTKAQVAAETCALLAFSATKNNDKVGLVLFTEETEAFLAPRKGRRQVLRVIREILHFQRRRRGTNLAAALEFATRTLTRRAVIFVVSDFQDEGYLEALAMTRRRHDVIAVDLFDPREREFVPVGLVELEDAETGERVLLDTGNQALLEDQALGRAAEALERRKLFESRGIDLVSISTRESPADPLAAFFERRRRRLRR